MKDNKLLTHPIFTDASDIEAICSPLKKLGITYFAHTHVNHEKKFSGISNNPEFGEHYLKNHYYNSDIHLADTELAGKHILWDTIALDGASKKMEIESYAFGVKHTFTMINKNIHGTDCYHFASNIDDPSMNHVYLANRDLLSVFIAYFKEVVIQSKVLSRAYDIKFDIANNAPGYDSSINTLNKMNRECFLKEISLSLSEINKTFNLSPQRLKCLSLLAQGYSAKQIASHLKLSIRTIENYIAYLRKQFSCRNSKELVSIYYSLLGK